MGHDPKLLEKKLSEAPEDLRQAIMSVDTGAALQNIGKAHQLHIDQIDTLLDETGLVMLGLTHPTAFVANIASRLAVPHDRAGEIGKDVNERIFRPVRESLKKLHRIADEGGETETIATVRETTLNLDQKPARVPVAPPPPPPALSSAPVSASLSPRPINGAQSLREMREEKPEQGLTKENILREIEESAPPARGETAPEAHTPEAPKPPMPAAETPVPAPSRPIAKIMPRSKEELEALEQEREQAVIKEKEIHEMKLSGIVASTPPPPPQDYRHGDPYREDPGASL